MSQKTRNRLIFFGLLLLGILLLILLRLSFSGDSDTDRHIPITDSPLPAIRSRPATTTGIRLSTGARVNLPPSLITPPEYFQIHTYNTYTHQLSDYATQFGFDQKISDNIYREEWTDSAIYLDEYNGKIYLTQTPGGHAHSGRERPFDESQILATATSFVTGTLQITTPLTRSTVEYLHTEGAHYDIAQNPEEADNARVNFHLQINDQAQFLGVQTDHPFASVTLNRDNDVVAAEFYPYSLQAASTQRIKSLSLEQSLSSNTSFFETIIGPDGFKIEPGLLSQIDVNTTDITYHLDPTIKQSYPMYHLTGVATINSGALVDIEFFVPAISTTN